METESTRHDHLDAFDEGDREAVTGSVTQCGKELEFDQMLTGITLSFGNLDAEEKADEGNSAPKSCLQESIDDGIISSPRRSVVEKALLDPRPAEVDPRNSNIHLC